MTHAASRFRLLPFLHRHGLWPALLGSAGAVGMLALRLGWSRGSLYAWMEWNLFLAWVPYGLSLGASYLWARGLDRRWAMAPLACAWLIVFPNAPYLLTDLI